MKFSAALVVAAIATVSTAIPSAESLPWAKANPAAAAAADAYADAYAEAVAIAHPDPEAYAMAASADDCATIECHASCGYLIIAARDCSVSGDSYVGPYSPGCLCGASDGTSEFEGFYADCLDCGWTLWKYYGGYLQNALVECAAENADYSATEPTGTSRCSTTLTDSYTVDTGINYSTYI